jgi:hypothetical protein
MKIGRIMEYKFYCAIVLELPLNFASLGRIELWSGRPHRGVSGPGINGAT